MNSGVGYNLPADIILVSHQHGDHNQVDLCAKKPKSIIISNEKALADGKHSTIIHLTPGQLFDRPKAKAWQAPNKLIVGDGEEINLL